MKCPDCNGKGYTSFPCPSCFGTGDIEEAIRIYAEIDNDVVEIKGGFLEHVFSCKKTYE
jgi:DnaJ-class molecular chaperone